MTDNTDITVNKRKIWVRGFFMLLMILLYQVTGTVVFIVMIIQFVLALINDEPNRRLVSFGRSLALYLQQIANFLTFTTEEVPFPFKDWPEQG